MADEMEGVLKVIADKVARDAFIPALQEIFAYLSAHPSEPRLYQAGLNVLSAAATRSETLPGWEAPEKTMLYRALLLQEKCPSRPLVFHHGVASLLTSGNTEAARAVTAEMMPLLEQFLAQDAVDKIPRPVVIFLMIVRSVLDRMSLQDRISALHVAHFPRMGLDDIALPYSVMFHPDIFGKNRDDLMRRFPDRDTALAPEAALGLRHLLLLEWLGGMVFSDADNADLLAALSSRLGSEASVEERAAARTLILRHWRQEGLLTADTFKRLRLSEKLLEAAAALKAPAVAGPVSDAALARLESRPWQAACALRAHAARVLPALAGGQRRIRVAICVSGQLRGWQRALESWRQSLLQGAEYDVFIHTWEKIGSASAHPTRDALPFEGKAFCQAWRRIGLLEGFDAMQALYPTLFGVLDAGARVDVGTLQQAYGTEYVVVEDDTGPDFAAFSNQDKMHYKIHAAHELAVASGWEYDLAVRIRPDLSLRMIGFDWRDMSDACNAAPLLFCDHRFGVHYGNPMIGDQIAVAAPETMTCYTRTWTNHAQLASAGLAKYPDVLEGHVSLAQNCWLSGIRTARVPMKIGELLSPENLSAAGVLAALEADSTKRQDRIDRELLDAVLTDLRS